VGSWEVGLVPVWAAALDLQRQLDLMAVAWWRRLFGFHLSAGLELPPRPAFGILEGASRTTAGFT
jgi:hypothetical protein